MRLHWGMVTVILMMIQSLSYGGPHPHAIEMNALLRQKRNPAGPLSLLAEMVTSKFIEGTEIQKTVLGNIQNIVSKIDDAMKEIENGITKMSEDIGVVNAQRLNITRDAIIRYQSVKQTLRITRNELKSLAKKTILQTNDLILYMEAWDSETYSAADQKEYLKEQLRIMKELLDDSKVKLNNAKTKYDECIGGLDAMVQGVTAIKVNIQKLLDTSSDEYADMAGKLRLGIYGSCGALAAGMVVADFLGCVGFCSGIVTTTVVTTSALTLEVSLNDIREDLERLERTVDRSIQGINGILAQNGDLKKFIQEESLLIIAWQASVEHLNGSITNADVNKLQRLGLKRREVTRNLIELKTAATNFWNQPDIWPQDKLTNTLNNPERIQENRNAIAHRTENMINIARQIRDSVAR